ncbi:carbon-monoxide dehydrogenase medium subunit [Thermanaeromonas toyohensis ToBE]|uniref:Carbon-monoxide dehydrogenase medium subunit n=1 Tax=Thermanaeromonas toyohensis ToBE TaxID=698762 RepID=A0A1W1VK79_9FIRM|nr:xanthine dehydrogenase family protein subunit M [Thermanaeromonas toyohensis]SMB93344.1 carbon-monoxide dehydrogenase medium subunit [Thermanaeromonas toyohensis ToBE]
MLDFKFYYQPQTLGEALELLATLPGKVRPLAGGTDIVPALRRGELELDGLVDISCLKELKGIEKVGERVRIGSLVTFSELSSSPLIRQYAPVLSEAASSVGSPQIRNLGTVGGNIVNASPAADSVPALVALEAEAKICSQQGERFLKVEEILCGAGKTCLTPGELIESIFFSLPPPNTKSGFLKLGRRNALAIARLSVAAVITLDPSKNKIAQAKVALGAVAPNPFRSEEIERLLVGAEVSSSLIEEAAALASQVVEKRLGSRPTAPYKKQAVKGVIRELLQKLLKPVEVKAS